MNSVRRIFDLPFKYHLAFGVLIRLLLILYGDYHDSNYDVPYTDVDYKVFTDAARHVTIGESPYRRQTYRYSPIIAFILTPNIFLYKNFGKLLFSCFDILITIAVKVLVEHQLGVSKERDNPKIATYCSLFWLYNPMSIAISTRGNADSVPCFFIIMSIFFLQTSVVKGLWKYGIAGVLLATAIHLRLYPLAFSFPMYLSLGQYNITKRTSLKNGLLILFPNAKQVILTVSCVITLFILTLTMYLMYGYEFLFETYIYHLFRKDTRHNFSVLFYYSYLTTDHLSFDIVKAISAMLILLILFMLSLTFGCEAKTLPFALFCQAVVMVAYNSVMTSQYFMWFLSLLPLIVHSLKLKPVKAIFLASIWVLAQGAWLFYAYLLEFKSRQVFIYIWLMSVIFFCANIYVLGQIIKSYNPNHGFGEGTKTIPKLTSFSTKKKKNKK